MVEIHTDHWPQTLDRYSRVEKGISIRAAALLQRWALLLSAYNYEIHFKPTQSHCNANGLSRLPLPVQDHDAKAGTVSIFNVAQIQFLQVTFQQVQTATRRDPLLTKIATYVNSGWPTKVPDELKPYQLRQQEIGCPKWMSHVGNQSHCTKTSTTKAVGMSPRKSSQHHTYESRC